MVKTGQIRRCQGTRETWETCSDNVEPPIMFFLDCVTQNYCFALEQDLAM